MGVADISRTLTPNGRRVLRAFRRQTPPPSGLSVHAGWLRLKEARCQRTFVELALRYNASVLGTCDAGSYEVVVVMSKKERTVACGRCPTDSIADACHSDACMNI